MCSLASSEPTANRPQGSTSAYPTSYHKPGRNQPTTGKEQDRDLWSRENTQIVSLNKHREPRKAVEQEQPRPEEQRGEDLAKRMTSSFDLRHRQRCLWPRADEDERMDQLDHDIQQDEEANQGERSEERFHRRGHGSPFVVTSRLLERSLLTSDTGEGRRGVQVSSPSYRTAFTAWHETVVAEEGPTLALPGEHPLDQPVPGPAGRVPTDWEWQLH